MSRMSFLSLRQANRDNGPCGREEAKERDSFGHLRELLTRLTRLGLTNGKPLRSFH